MNDEDWASPSTRHHDHCGALPQGMAVGSADDVYDMVWRHPSTTTSSSHSWHPGRLQTVSIAAALLICAVVASSMDQTPKIPISLDTELQGATLPGYSPAALALATQQKSVAKILERERKRQSAPPPTDDAEPALSKKALNKIISAARAAAKRNNDMIADADQQLRESQKELGSNAASVHLLTGGDSSGGAADQDAGTNLADLIRMARQDKMAAPALKAATAAADRNKKLMAQAGEELRDSQRVLGKDAVGLPSLGKPLNPDSLQRFVHGARGGSSGAGAAQRSSAPVAEQKAAAAARLEKKFIAATALAREMP